MKKIITLGLALAGGFLLAGCTLTGDKTPEQVVNVETTAETTTGAKDECLAKHYQWNDSTSRCEKLNPQVSCLNAGNQWNNTTESCDYSKDNCLAAGHQWNEDKSLCEYSKENCLKMNAQWDEKASQCETLPETTEQKVEDCVSHGGQWNYSGNSCEQQEGAYQMKGFDK